ncbi:hypothetical protein [Geopseudomonas aromaticivorans]
MRVWEQLNLWTNDALIGPVALELVSMAQRHGADSAPMGVPVEQPIAFNYPAINDDEKVEQFLRRVSILYQAIDRHMYWHRGIMVTVRPFREQPDWLDDPVALSTPAWEAFVAEAEVLIDGAVKSMIARAAESH